MRYRREGGAKTNVLADFFIGAHAAVSGYPLLTRDPRRYRTYFSRRHADRALIEGHGSDRLAAAGRALA